MGFRVRESTVIAHAYAVLMAAIHNHMLGSAQSTGQLDIACQGASQ